METVEIRCPKSILNVAERAKKGKNRYVSGFSERSGRRGHRFKSCHPDQQNLSNQAVSEVFDLLENMYFLNLTTCFFDSNSGVNFRPVEFISHMQN